MIKTLLMLFTFNFMGSTTALYLGLALPGPLVGLVCMALYVWLNKPALLAMQPGVAKLLKHLSLFFIPAGVGITAHMGLLRAEWALILVALVASTILTIAVTAISFQWAQRFAASPQPTEA